MNPETTSGGRALRFYASVRISVRAGERITGKNKDDVIGHVINTRIVKNKTASPFKKASFELIYGKGVDKVKEIIDIALLGNIIQRAGAYYQIKDEDGEIIIRNFNNEDIKLSFQGKDKFADYLKTDNELCLMLEHSVRTGDPLNIDKLKITEDTK